ncbi:MAG TPA: transposase, partial [Fimbriimonadaceae bacterium]|nr:transposase [Fimbriimonadaceae bacterium]HRJ34286.1 transposase [Fimbriimonadaceae bacterium]
MKKSKFSEEQVVRILQEVEAGKAVREVCRAHGLSEATFYAWKRKYAGMETQDVKRMRHSVAPIGPPHPLKRFFQRTVLPWNGTPVRLGGRDAHDEARPASLHAFPHQEFRSRS